MANKPTTGPQPTPISVLLSLYAKPNQPPLTIAGLDDIEIKTQIEYLDPETVGHQSGEGVHPHGRCRRDPVLFGRDDC